MYFGPFGGFNDGAFLMDQGVMDSRFFNVRFPSFSFLLYFLSCAFYLLPFLSYLYSSLLQLHLPISIYSLSITIDTINNAAQGQYQPSKHTYIQTNNKAKISSGKTNLSINPHPPQKKPRINYSVYFGIFTNGSMHTETLRS